MLEIIGGGAARRGRAERFWYTAAIGAEPPALHTQDTVRYDGLSRASGRALRGEFSGLGPPACSNRRLSEGHSAAYYSLSSRIDDDKSYQQGRRLSSCARSKRDVVRCLALPRRQVAQSFGQRFLAPVTRHPIRRPHNPPRPFPTLRQTSRVQQPPRRRKSRHTNVPPVLPQQVKRAQLMRRLPAIDQLNPRRDGPVPIADQMLRDAARPTARPGQSLRPRNRKPPTPFPQRHRGSPSIRYAPGGFASTGRPVPAFRPAATPARPKAPSPATCRPYS